MVTKIEYITVFIDYIGLLNIFPRFTFTNICAKMIKLSQTINFSSQKNVLPIITSLGTGRVLGQGVAPTHGMRGAREAMRAKSSCPSGPPPGYIQPDPGASQTNAARSRTPGH